MTITTHSDQKLSFGSSSDVIAHVREQALLGKPISVEDILTAQRRNEVSWSAAKFQELSGVAGAAWRSMVTSRKGADAMDYRRLSKCAAREAQVFQFFEGQNTAESDYYPFG